MDLDPQLVALATRLAESAARNTAASIATRVSTAKSAKRDREALVELEEIITELSEDRSELLQIAQAFKEQLAGQMISAEDVGYITSQLVPKLKEFVELTADSQPGGAEAAREMIDVLSPLLSVETVTILQLLGFSLKRAIGEPLTDLVARAIASRAPGDPAADFELQRLSAKRELAIIDLANNEDAYRRFQSLISRT